MALTLSPLLLPFPTRAPRFRERSLSRSLHPRWHGGGCVDRHAFLPTTTRPRVISAYVRARR